MVNHEQDQATLIVYTRKADEAYPGGLARSVHFAVSRDGREYEPLNQNYGILFAQAVIRRDNTLQTKALTDPIVFPMGDGYGIGVVRVEENGTPDESSAGMLVLWQTRDFMEFREMGQAQKESLPLEKIARRRACVMGETVECCGIEIASDLCDRLVAFWNTPRHVATRAPQRVKVSSREEVQAIRATAVYSDGSTALKRVEWDLGGVDFSSPGCYTVKGKLVRKKYPFPLAKGYGDPVVFPWNGKWYFLGTNDNLNDIGIYIREADTPEELFAPGTEEHLILGVDSERDFIQTFWAPEFHIIGGQPWILFAVGGRIWGPQCHLMQLKPDGKLTAPEGWETPVRVVRKDGSPLAPEGISLDMTYLLAGGRSYMVWSYREHIGTPEDTGSMLYIAEADAGKPWQLAGEPVLLSRPLYSWENVNGTINNEGPHAFVRGGKVYLTYSGGDAAGYTYAVGMLTADEHAPLTDISVWTKSGHPVLTYYSVPGEYGPGHNSFFTDEDGDLMIAYHGETSLESRLRCDGIRRVHFNVRGEPEFGLSPAQDVDSALAQVQTSVIVGSGENAS